MYKKTKPSFYIHNNKGGNTNDADRGLQHAEYIKIKYFQKQQKDVLTNA